MGHLHVGMQLNVPDLDEFDEAAWGRTIKTKIEEFISFEVTEITVVDVSRALHRIISALEKEPQLDIMEYRVADTYFSPDLRWLSDFADRAATE